MKKITASRLLVAASAESADILYGSGFLAADEFTYAEINDKKYIFVSVMESARAKQAVHSGVTVLCARDVLLKVPKEIRDKWLVALSRFFEVSCWQVPETFPLVYAKQLQEAGIKVEMVEGPFFPERSVKTPDEVDKIRQCELAVVDAQMQVRQFISESIVNSRGYLEWKGEVLTCEFLRGAVEMELKRRSFSTCGTIISCGPDSAIPHCIGAGPIKAGVPIVSDIFPRNDLNGYWGDMTRTFVKGKLSKRLHEMYQAVLHVNETVEATLKPGISCSLMQEYSISLLEKAGFRTGIDAEGFPFGYFHGLGHSVGLEIHEFPRFSCGEKSVLSAGNVISVEPGLYYHDIGGIRIEDLVLITETGIENLSPMSKEIEVP